MKIKRIVMKNFIGIYNGLGEKKFEVDLTKFDTKFIMLKGSIGSGKSTFMKALHPFPFYDDNKIIRRGKKGYKELHLDDNGIEYICKIFYEPTTTGHSTKSFISQIMPSGEEMELNPNGNVTSYEEVILSKFGLSKEVLQIMKLGADMKSFINLKATDRKKFITKFTEDVNIFIDFNKQISDDCRLFEKMIKSTENELSKYENIEVINSRLDAVNKSLNKINEKRDAILKEQSIAESKLNEINPDIMTMYKNIKTKFVEISNEFNKNKEIFRILKVDEPTPKIIENLLNLYNEANMKSNKALGEYNSGISETTESLKKERLEQDEIEDKMLDLEDNIVKPTNENIVEIFKNIEKYIIKNKSAYEDISDSIKNIDKGVMVDCVNLIMNINQNIESTLESVEVKMLEYFEPKFIHSITKEKERLKLEREHLLIEQSNCTNIKNLSDKECEFVTCNRDKCNSCILMQQYTNALDMKIKTDNINASLFVINDKIEEINTIQTLYSELNQKINAILMVLNPKLEQLELEKITLDMVFKMVRDTRMEGFNFRFIEDMIRTKEFSIDYENKLSIFNTTKKEKEIYENSIKLYESSKKQYDWLKDRFENLNVSINDKAFKLENLQDALKRTKDNINTQENIIDKLKLSLELLIEKDKMEEIVIRYKDDINSIKDNESIVSNCEEALDDLFDMQKESLKSRDILMYKSVQRKKLDFKLKALNDNFKDYDMMRKASSPTKGIPLVFVRIYLNITRQIANELLSKSNIALKIEKFIVDEKEFRIPCSGKGEINDDIKTTSSGERALISLAMLFALVKQNASKYNVITLDELDGPLDSEHRRLYVDLLEEQMSSLGIEQSFIISHNDEFSCNDGLGFILFKGGKTNSRNVFYKHD